MKKLDDRGLALAPTGNAAAVGAGLEKPPC